MYVMFVLLFSRNRSPRQALDFWLVARQLIIACESLKPLALPRLKSLVPIIRYVIDLSSLMSLAIAATINRRTTSLRQEA